MAATLSSTGTWTPLKTDLTQVDITKVGAQMVTQFLNGKDLDPVPQEIQQIIELAQAGWGAQNGTNHLLGYWATVVLLRDMLTAYIGVGVPNPH